MVKKVCYTVSALCFLYFIGLVSILGISYHFNFVWIVIGSFFFSLAYFKEKINCIPNCFKKTFLIVLCLILLFFLCIEGQIVSASLSKPESHADYLIVLGAKVNGTTPSIALKSRVYAASDYLKENPNTRVIASGGQGSDENISEAKAIYNLLITLGIDSKRIILEENSTNTKENFHYASEFIQDNDATVVIASSNFHLFRAMLIAKKMEYKNISGLPSKVMPFLLPQYYLREFCGVCKELLTGKG